MALFEYLAGVLGSVTATLQEKPALSGSPYQATKPQTNDHQNWPEGLVQPQRQRRRAGSGLASTVAAAACRASGTGLGAGPALRTSMSCVGAARCEMSCFDEARALRVLVNNNIDDMHRPSLPYKFKFKF